jgi:Flp pilus assembly protein TadG
MTRVPPFGPRANQRGTALIEFAIVLPFLLVLTFMVVDFARAFHYKHMLASAARQGARTFAVIPLDAGGGPDQAAIETAVRQVFNPTDATGGVITSIVASGPDGSNPLNRTVTVTVRSSFFWKFPGLIRMTGASAPNPTTLTAACSMRYERPS